MDPVTEDALPRSCIARSDEQQLALYGDVINPRHTKPKLEPSPVQVQPALGASGWVRGTPDTVASVRNLPATAIPPVSLDFLGISWLKATPTDPQVRITFEIPGFGKLATLVHDALLVPIGVLLVVDTRKGAMTQLRPQSPRNVQLRINDGEPILLTEYVVEFNLGKLSFTMLFADTSEQGD